MGITMNGQMRNKARLLAHASTVAILAAAGQYGVVAEAQAACQNITTPTTISADVECAQVTDGTVTGNVVNNANVGPPEDEYTTAGFFVGGGEGLIDGQLINNDTITGGDALYFGALTIGDGSDISGGILNNGQILSGSGNAISLGYFNGDIYSEAAMTGGITNSGGINGAVAVSPQSRDNVGRAGQQTLITGGNVVCCREASRAGAADLNNGT
jgi:hypothetical protein